MQTVTGKHFDPKIVDEFLKISTYDILSVILSDTSSDLAKDENLLREFNLSDLYGILINGEDKSKHHLKLVKSFNKHYHNL